MDLDKLTTGDKAVAASGILLLVFSFFPWFGIEVGPFSYTRNGWDNFLSLLAVLVGILMVVHVVLSRLTTVKLPDIPMPWGRVHLIAGIVAAALVLLQLLFGDSAGGVDLDRKFGLFLGLVAALGLAAGGFLKNQEDPGTATAPGAGGTVTPPTPEV